MPDNEPEQEVVFAAVMSCVESGPDYDGPNVFYSDGPAGSGKTFLYLKLLRKVRSTGRIAIAVAMSGIAAQLLEGGRTAHSRFK